MALLKVLRELPHEMRPQGLVTVPLNQQENKRLQQGLRHVGVVNYQRAV